MYTIICCNQGDFCNHFEKENAMTSQAFDDVIEEALDDVIAEALDEVWDNVTSNA